MKTIKNFSLVSFLLGLLFVSGFGTSNAQVILKKTIGRCQLTLVQGDITKQFKNNNLAAIVNAANTRLRGGSGIDGAVHKAAGGGLLKELKTSYPRGCNVGDAKITNGHNLAPVKIIHAVGPIGSDSNKKTLLTNAYKNSLQCAIVKKIRYVAFPAISTGIFGYDINDATQVAIESVIDFVKNDKNNSFKEIRFVVWDDNARIVYQTKMEKININQSKVTSSNTKRKTRTSQNTTQPKKTKIIKKQQYDSDIQRAIRLSLQEKQQNKNQINNPNLDSGIKNYGDTCFLNASLQCLSHLPGLTQAVLNRTQGTRPTTTEYLNFLGSLQAQQSDPIDLIIRTQDQWELNIDNRQEDAEEFIDKLLNSMIEEEQGNSIQKLFNTNKPDSTDNERDKLIIQLPLNNYDLKQIIKNYQKNSANDQLSNKLKFLAQPEYLMFQLKRSRTEPIDGKLVSSKILDPISFPMKDFSLDQFMATEENAETGASYNLVAILIHDGSSLNGGHYYAYCKNPADSKWRLFNDKNVSLVSDVKITNITETGEISLDNENATPYILFYAKQHENGAQLIAPIIPNNRLNQNPPSGKKITFLKKWRERKKQVLKGDITSLELIIKFDDIDPKEKAEAEESLNKLKKQLEEKIKIQNKKRERSISNCTHTNKRQKTGQTTFVTKQSEQKAQQLNIFQRMINRLMGFFSK